MASTIGTAYIQIEPTTEGISGKLESVLGGEATKVGKSAGGKLSNALGSAAKVGFASVTALAGAATTAGAALVSSAGSVAEYGDNIDKMSQKMGVSSTFYQEWDAVLQHSGTSMDAMKGTFKTLSKAVQDGSKEQNAAFEALGLSMEELQGMSTEEVFQKTVTALQGMEEGTERTTLASQLLGKGAVEMGALFNTSAEDTQAMIDTVHELGGVMSEDAVKDSAAFQDSLQNMQTAFSGLKNSAMSELLPSFTQIMDGITAMASGQDNASQLIAEGITGLVESIKKALPLIQETLSTLLNAFMEVAPELITTLAQGIIDSLPVLVPAVVDIVVSIATYLLDHIDIIINAAIQLVVGLVKGIIQSLPKLIEAGKKLLTTVVEGWKMMFSLIGTAASDMVNNLKNKIIAKKNQMLEAGKNLIKSIKEGLVQAWNDVVSWFQNKIDELKEKFTSIFNVSLPDWMTGGGSSGTSGTGTTSTQGLTYNPSLSSLNNGLQPITTFSNNTNVTVTLEGDASRLFRVIQSEASRNAMLVGG